MGPIFVGSVVKFALLIECPRDYSFIPYVITKGGEGYQKTPQHDNYMDNPQPKVQILIGLYPTPTCIYLRQYKDRQYI